MTDIKTSGPELTWLENNIPVSTQFNDSYFSRLDGRAETQEVFIAGNGLPDRWTNEKIFTIAELGFGVGLNFLETLYQWKKTACSEAKLHFISFELYPVEATEIDKATQRWPELATLTNQLTAHWPPQPGPNRFNFENACLHLHIGDARETIKNWNTTANAWYLDGFSPAKNPELWDLDLLKEVYNHTSPKGTFSTYTSAGWVRRNLEEAGFAVSKVPGFQYKKERLQGARKT